MKKILVAHAVHNYLKHDPEFREWTGIVVFVAASNDEALEIHRAERVDLIITDLKAPGMSSSEFCAAVRDDLDLRTVSIIVICANEIEAIEEGLRCRANAILLRPVHPLVLMTKARQLVNVPPRGAYDALVRVRIQGEAGEKTFFCRSQNISAAGMLIETEQQLNEGMRIECSFLLPGSTQVAHMPMKIVRAAGQTGAENVRQYGAMFTDMPSAVRQLLVDYGKRMSAE